MSLTTGSSSFAKRNQHILGAKILNLIEKYPEGPPISAILDLHKNTLGNGDVTNFHNVQPRTKKGLTRSRKPIFKPKSATVSKSRKSPSAGKTPSAANQNILKSTSLTSNHSTYSSKSRPSSAQKSRSSNSKAPSKTPSAKSPSAITSQKPKPSSSGPNQGRPSTATGDFADTQSKSNTSSVGKPLTQRMKNIKSGQAAPRKKPVVSDTRVVLAPRFGPESTESSVLNVGQPRSSTAPPGQLWRRESPPTVKSVFPAEKTKWVQQAVYKIGESLWSASGLIPPKKVIHSPVIQDNFGKLYDLAVKSQFRGLPNDPVRKNSSDTRTFSDEQSTYSRSSVGTQLSFVSTATEPPSHDPEKEQQASNLILKNFRAKLVKQNTSSRMKDATTITQPDLNNNFDASGNETKPTDESEDKDEEDTPNKSHNCYVSNGKIIPDDEPFKFTVSSFAPLSSSLRRVRPSLNNTYFRRTVDLKGFEVHEIRFKYSSSRIFVEGKQQQKGDKNARLVREIIALPPELTIENLKVMRGKRGAVVFEEIIKSQ